MKDIRQHHDEMIKELPVWIRKSSISALSDIVGPDDVLAIKESFEKNPSRWWAGHHHGWGTGVRNFLRHAVCLDSELPSGNWDDYYIPIIEIYCGVRDE